MQRSYNDTHYARIWSNLNDWRTHKSRNFKRVLNGSTCGRWVHYFVYTILNRDIYRERVFENEKIYAFRFSFQRTNKIVSFRYDYLVFCVNGGLEHRLNWPHRRWFFILSQRIITIFSTRAHDLRVRFLIFSFLFGKQEIVYNQFSFLVVTWSERRISFVRGTIAPSH